MGIPIDENLLSIYDLIENMNWYKDFITDDFDPESESEHFIFRNKDLFVAINNLNEEFNILKKCKEENDYSFSPNEIRIRTLKTLFLLRLGRYI